MPDHEQQVPQIQMASKQLRLGSWPIAYFTSPFWSMIFLVPIFVAQPLTSSLGKTFGEIVLASSMLLTVGLAGWMAWRLSLNGMTFRHFIAGYQVRHKDGRLPNVFTLYAREFVAVIAGSFVLLKVLLPALMKRGMEAGLTGEDKHVVVKDGNGNLFVSKQNIGQMRDQQMNADLQVAMQAAIAKAHTEEWFHDKLFNTAPVMASRMEVLRPSKPTPKPQPAPMKKVG